MLQPMIDVKLCKIPCNMLLAGAYAAVDIVLQYSPWSTGMTMRNGIT